MNSFNNTGGNIMIRMKKKNYIQERQNNFILKDEINEYIAGGGSPYLPSDRLWRGKTQSFMAKTNPEETFLLKEIMKKFQTNQDEAKGYNYKYVLQLSDLLGQKDKDFSKKRLELYNHRIEREKKKYAKTHEKFIKYQTAYKPKKQSNFYLEYFNNKSKNTFITNMKANKFNNTLENKNGKNRNNNEFDIYNKTSYNYNSPNKLEKLKYLLNDKTDKKSKHKKFGNFILELNKSNEIEEEFDNTSLVGKEDFLVSGDKEKYHEYLQREYHFFNPLKIRQMKYIFDKQKRIKLFKKLPNAKYLKYKKDNPLRIELFNKINREKQKLYYEFPKSVNRKLKLSDDENMKNYTGPKSKAKMEKEYQNIVQKLKKNLQIV